MTKPRDQLRVGGKTNSMVSFLMERTVQWGDLFERVQIKAGQNLYSAGMRTQFIYAPIDAVVSTVTTTGGDQPNGKPQPDVTVSVLGAEDIVGVAQLLGDAPLPAGAICDMGGSVLRAPVQAARRLMDMQMDSRELIQAYNNLVTAESWQWFAASTQLDVLERVAAFLLLHWQRSGTEALPVTHYMLSERMAIRRPSITRAIQILDDGYTPPDPGRLRSELGSKNRSVPGMGLVRQVDRGRIDIRDAEGLGALVRKAWPLYGTHRQAFLDALTAPL